MALIVGLPDAAESSPSRASLNGLDGTNFFNAAMLAGFGPYVAVYLAEQKWTQENIGFVLTASGLAGLLALMPGGQLLDTVRSKRALVALGASMVAVTALVIGIWPNFPLVFTALVLHGTTGAFLGPAIAAISLGVVGHFALAEQLGRNQARSWGRRPLLIIGFGTLPIRALLFAFFEDPLFLIGFQLLDGVSGAIIGVLTALVTADITHGSGRFNLAQGIIGTASGIGAALSTAVFGLIAANFGHTTTFLSMAAVALLGASIMWLLMPETRPSTEK